MDCWSWNVDAADAKKAEGASIWALHIPGLHLPQAVMLESTGFHWGIIIIIIANFTVY